MKEKVAKASQSKSAKDKSNQLSFVNIKVETFNSFLDRFLPFDDNNLLLEITPESVIAKAYLADHSSIKYSAIPFDEVLQIKESEEVPQHLKIGLINIKQYQKALEYLGTSDTVSLIINYATMLNIDDEIECVSISNIFNNNKDLKFTFENGSMMLFEHITDDTFFDQIAYIESPVFTFRLQVEDLIKIKRYSAIDKGDKNLIMEYKKNSVYISNQNFKYKLPSEGITGEEDSSARFDTSYLSMLDLESYDVQVSDSRVVFSSIDSKTFLVLGRNDAI